MIMDDRARELYDMTDHVLRMQRSLLQSQAEMIQSLQSHILRLEGVIAENKTLMGVLDQ